jgi:hypothetical protein
MKSRSLFAVFALVALLVGPACSHAPSSVVTPQGKAAFAADQVVTRLAEIQNAVIVAATPDAAGKVAIAKPQADIIVGFIVDAAKIIKQTPNGWIASVSQAWTLAKKRIPAATLPSVQGYVLAIDTLLAASGGAPLP